jgi:serine protease
VRYDRGATHADRLAVERATGTGSAEILPGGNRALRIEDGATVSTTLDELRAQPGVAYALPDYRLHAASNAFYPNDPGRGGPGDWRKLQWNFDSPFGVHAPQAWGRMRALDRDGGRGVIVAVVDSGVAYTNHGRYRRAPDLYKGRFVKGWDFVGHDRYPLDADSHGTHVTGTIAEHVNNKLAVTGLAYGVRIMPLRVLDSNGDGDGTTLARSLRWAVKHGADVINMSVEFDSQLRAADIPDVISAIRYVHKKGVVMVGASGNDTENHVAYPARDHDVIAVGATTVDGCRAEYSNGGTGLDIAAPGGGSDAQAGNNAWDQDHCDPGSRPREIYQQTFVHNPRNFRLLGFEGTSEATPHVSAIAALVIASGVIGSHPSPDAVLQRLEQTAQDMGDAGYDRQYGYGLVNAAAAVGG